jgi:hypothetical protein
MSAPFANDTNTGMITLATAMPSITSTSTMDVAVITINTSGSGGPAGSSDSGEVAARSVNAARRSPSTIAKIAPRKRMIERSASPMASWSTTPIRGAKASSATTMAPESGWRPWTKSAAQIPIPTSRNPSIRRSRGEGASDSTDSGGGHRFRAGRPVE